MFAKAKNKTVKMKEISIVNSGLVSVSPNALDGFDFNELESIDLSWNELKSVPQVVLRLEKLRHLDLSHNKVFVTTSWLLVQQFKKIAMLKLSRNK